MIRINLIQKKQASYVNAGGRTTGVGIGTFKGLGGGGLSEALPLMKSIGLPLLFCVAANFAYDYYIQQVTDEMTLESSKLTEEKSRIEKELLKIKGFESVKIELERNELVLRTKIETIEKLIRGRDFTVKSLVTLAQAMPRDIWMTEVAATDTAFELKGGTVDLGLVSDFMSKLGQSIYFRDVTLKNTSADASGHQANFDLTARRE